MANSASAPRPSAGLRRQPHFGVQGGGDRAGKIARARLCREAAHAFLLSKLARRSFSTAAAVLKSG